MRVMPSTKEDRWTGHVGRMGEKRGAYGVLTGKLKGRIQLERPRRRWEGKIKMNLREVGWGHGLNLADDRNRW